MSSRAAGAPLSVSMSAGRPQTSSPFVHREVPWPTVKPRLPAGSRSQFSSDDLPDRCGPHMATTQSSASIAAITSAVSGTSRSFLSPASSTTFDERQRCVRKICRCFQVRLHIGCIDGGGVEIGHCSQSRARVWLGQHGLERETILRQHGSCVSPEAVWGSFTLKKSECLLVCYRTLGQLSCGSWSFGCIHNRAFIPWRTTRISKR